MSRPVAFRGLMFSIEYALLADGTCPGLEYYNDLPRQFKNRFNVLFKKLGDTGKIFNKEQFKIIEGTEFFEFKAHIHRLPCQFTDCGEVIITHGLEKKRPKLVRRILIEREEFTKRTLRRNQKRR
jgi:hypothetical protein